MKTRKSGFTLVEILIVVIILGILAAIVIPQFTEASSDARESTLTSNLQTLRSQIGLYKIQHNDNYPNTEDGGATADADADNFIDRLCNKTDIDGLLDATGDYGPYMQNVPLNPFQTDDTAPLFRLDGDTTAAGDDSANWVFDAVTGNIWADDADASPDGTDHSDL